MTERPRGLGFGVGGGAKVEAEKTALVGTLSLDEVAKDPAKLVNLILSSKAPKSTGGRGASGSW